MRRAVLRSALVDSCRRFGFRLDVFAYGELPPELELVPAAILSGRPPRRSSLGQLVPAAMRAATHDRERVVDSGEAGILGDVVRDLRKAGGLNVRQTRGTRVHRRW